MPLRFNPFLRTRSRVTGAAIKARVNQLETLINKQEPRSTLPSLYNQTRCCTTSFRFDYLCSPFPFRALLPEAEAWRSAAVIGGDGVVCRRVSGGGSCQSVPGCRGAPERGRCQRLNCCFPSVALVGFSSQHGHSCLQPLHPAQPQLHDPRG